MGPPSSEDLWQLTPKGRVQARTMGGSLPAYRHLFLTHTRIQRTRDTATEIADGFRRRYPAAEVGVRGVDPALSLTTFYARDATLREQWREKLGEQFYAGWIAGDIPPEAISPVGVAVSELMERLRSHREDGPDSALHVAVTHDVFVTAIREVLFGPWTSTQPPVGFLEGVVLARDPRGRLTARSRDKIAVLADPDS